MSPDSPWRSPPKMTGCFHLAVSERFLSVLAIPLAGGVPGVGIPFWLDAYWITTLFSLSSTSVERFSGVGVDGNYVSPHGRRAAQSAPAPERLQVGADSRAAAGAPLPRHLEHPPPLGFPEKTKLGRSPGQLPSIRVSGVGLGNPHAVFQTSPAQLGLAAPRPNKPTSSPELEPQASHQGVEKGRVPHEETPHLRLLRAARASSLSFLN